MENNSSAFRYEKTDAFTAPGSRGNPAACLFLRSDQKLTDRQMQEIASEHRGFVSEVVYCREMDGKTFSLRYFSSECEVDFCGHGTIACMYSLIKQSAHLRNEKELMIRTKNAELPVYNRIPDDDAVFIAAPEPVYGNALPGLPQIAAALNVNQNSLSTELPAALINAGLNTLIVPIKTLECEISVTPDEQVLKTFCADHGIDIVLIFCPSVQDSRHFAHTRVFAAKFGYLEDPATGSGNSAFGYYLLRNKLWKGENIAMEQGGSDRAYNTVRLALEAGRVLFGGSATTRIRGEYLLDI